MIRKYHNHKLQTTPWHREKEPFNHHETPGRKIKQSNQLSLLHQVDCNTRIDIKKLTFLTMGQDFTTPPDPLGGVKGKIFKFCNDSVS